MKDSYKIIRDCDLTNKFSDPSDVEEKIVLIEKITQDNYHYLCPPVFNKFEYAIIAYFCDICRSRSSTKNPVYTNKENQRCDICTNCLSLIPFNETIFSLKEIYNRIPKTPSYSDFSVYKLSDDHVSKYDIQQLNSYFPYIIISQVVSANNVYIKIPMNKIDYVVQELTNDNYGVLGFND